jgi:Tfp pilus assembly protein PilF
VPKLALLLVVTGLGFFATRAVAGYERRQQHVDAAVWRDRGRAALEGGRPADAVAAFRRALAKDRLNQAYALELATALTSDGNLPAAEQVLLAERQRSPENPEINLQLARLEARRGADDAAVRYFRSALYAPWPDAGAPLQVRLELSEFLLAHNRQTAAASELIAALSQSEAADVDARKRIAQLLQRAGDPARALRTFEEVLERAPGDGAALAGAGLAAFALGRYADAARYLRGAPSGPEVDDTRDVTEQVIAGDPLGARLSLAERRRRAAADLDVVSASLQACRETNPGAAAETLDSSIDAVRDARAGIERADRDRIEDIVVAIGTAEQELSRVCGAPAAADRALIIVARLHAERP